MAKYQKPTATAIAAAAATPYGIQSRCMCRSLFCIGNQPEMRGWIPGVNCLADFSHLFQKFFRSKFKAAISFGDFAKFRLRCNSTAFFRSSSKANSARSRAALILSNSDCRIVISSFDQSRSGSGFSSGDGASASGTGPLQAKQSTSKYHFPGSVKRRHSLPPLIGAYIATMRAAQTGDQCSGFAATVEGLAPKSSTRNHIGAPIPADGEHTCCVRPRIALKTR
jgi:hypothetical protein